MSRVIPLVSGSRTEAPACQSRTASLASFRSRSLGATGKTDRTIRNSDPDRFLLCFPGNPTRLPCGPWRTDYPRGAAGLTNALDSAISEWRCIFLRWSPFTSR